MADSTNLTRSTRPPWDRWYRRSHWTALRTIVLAKEPICRICQRAASTVADHIVPHKGNWALFCDLDNLEGICDACHSKKTATEDGGFGNRPASNPSETNTPVVTGDSGKQFQSSTLSAKKLDKALAFDVDLLLKDIPQ